MSLADAAQVTIEGEMCEMCRVVERAKQSEQKQTSAPDAIKGKLVLICETEPCLVYQVPPPAEWRGVEFVPLEGPTQSPPTPPPRAA